MATGGIFQLITNDGKQDRMLMASALLQQRIQEAEARRKADPTISDKTPTLYDIEKTHILFTNAHFKPFAAIGYEYNKVTQSAGSSSLGSTVTFSIPQFGDFFNDMVVHAVLRQPTLEAGTVTDVGQKNLMRWCNYPGERLLKRVRFEVNGNPLDEYTSDAVNFYREFQVQPNKQVGWERCMGQEQPEHGFVQQPNWVGNNTNASAVGHRLKATTYSGNQTPTGQKDITSDGDLELFIPLLFWCNKDPRLAVPSVAIPYGQRFITMDLANQTELVGEVTRGGNNDVAAGGKLTNSSSSMIKTFELYINNIFVNPEVHNIFIKRIGFSLIRVHRRQEYTNPATTATTDLLLQSLKWPIETLFVGLRVHAYNDNDVENQRQNLDKWHKFSQVNLVKRESLGWNSQQVSVHSGANLAALDAALVSPATFTVSADVLVGQSTITSTVALTAFHKGDVLSFTSGGLPYEVTVQSVSADNLTLTLVEDPVLLAALDGVNLVTGGNVASALTLAKSKATPQAADVQKCVPTLGWVTIRAHGIPIYNAFPATFYNAYLPYNYGGHNIRTPEDCGALMITFCLYPGTYQPSGHINVSRAREFYIQYNVNTHGDNHVGKSQEGLLVVVASAINFLLISDGSAVLRYST